MCGIVGVIAKDAAAVPETEMVRLTGTLRHRGPDDQGIYIDGHIALGHTRLSILDRSEAGRQPMERGGIVIAYNGEVYNFAELRSKLRKQGVAFRSHTDTEVVLESYRHNGIDAFERFIGMFACAVYDKHKQQVHFVRDHFGIKPLYIYEDDGKIVYASELRTVLQASGVQTTLDPKALREYLQLHYIRHPRTPFKKIRKLQPGSIETYDVRRRTWTKHRLSFKAIDTSGMSRQEAVDEIQGRLTQSVRRHMVSDVDVGVFLSGGVDSGMIAAIASRQSAHTLHSFSVAFKDDAFFDESGYAKAVARRYGLAHHVVYADMHRLDEQLQELVVCMDEPLADSSVFLTHTISAFAKKYVGVVLSGVGGDELFGGYNRHRAFVLQRYLRHVPGVRYGALLERILGSSRSGRFGNAIRHFAKTVQSIGQDANATYRNVVSYAMLDHLDLGIGSYALSEALRYDLRYYMSDNLLAFTDRISMAHSLEVRTPFLDQEFVRFALGLPDTYKATYRVQKAILKQAAEAYLPKSIIYRRKQGFAAPVEHWLRSVGKKAVLAMIDKDMIHEIAGKAIVDQDIEAFFDRRIDRSMQLYAAIVLTRWYRAMKEYA